MKNRIISCWLILCLMLPTVSGCTPQGDPSITTQDTTSIVEETTETEETVLDPFQLRASVDNGLPDNLSFSGTDITVAVMSDDRYKMDWYSEALTGERINDLIYQRNLAISEKMDVNLQVVTDYNDGSSVATLQTATASGDDTYQIVNFSSQYVIPVLQQQILIDLMETQYLDLDRPWWNQSIRQNTTMNDKLYLVTGEIAFHYLNGTSCMLFNKSLAEDLLKEDIYDMVFDGRWTVDKLYALSEQAYVDLNGDGIGDEGDQWGLVTDWNAALDAYYIAFDQPITRLENGYPTLCVNTEKMVNIVEQIYDLYWNNTGVLKHDNPGLIFTSGNSLFINGLIGTYTAYTRDVDFNYGLLPYPKWEETQASYGAHNRNGYSQYGIPKTCGSIDASSAVLEYACSENYRIIIPEYINTNLKIQYANDQATAMILDIILNSIGVDFAFYSDIMYILREIIRNQQGANFASYYASKENTYNSIINKVVRVYAQ